eukprot:gene1177-10691_t
MSLTGLFVGDNQLLKTGLIQYLTTGEYNTKAKVNYAKPYELEIKEITFNFIDADPSIEPSTLFSSSSLEYIDVVFLTIESEKDLEKVEKEWIEEIKNKRKPLYILFQTDDLLGQNLINFDSLQNYELYFGYFLFLKEKPTFFDELLQQLCEIFFIQPLNTIYDFKTKELTKEAVLALDRIFWYLDEDHDGILNKKEVKQLSHVQIGVNSNEFLELQKNFIQEREYEKVWKLLKAFHYDIELNLDFTELTEPFVEHSIDKIVNMSPKFLEKLKKIFHYFDYDKDNCLNDNELQFVFKIINYNPFEDEDLILEKNEGKLTLKGWISLWHFILYRNFEQFLNSLCYLGLSDDLESFLDFKKKGEVSDIIQCFVFGAIKVGKTSFISRGSSSNKPTKKQTSSIFKIKNQHLILTEFPDSKAMSIINSNELSKCHVICLLYDGSDKYSFSYLTDIQVAIFKSNSNIPCVYFETKADLEQVEQNHEVTPSEFCLHLSLTAPISCSCLKEPEALTPIFEQISYIASDPEIAIPRYKDDVVDKKSTKISPKTIIKRTITILSVVGIVSSIFWFYVKRDKKEE